MLIVILYFALIAAAFFIWVVIPQRRRLAARQALIQSLRVGDDIITAGGIHGTIRAMSDTTIDVEVAPQVVLTLAREAVSSRREASELPAAAELQPPLESPPDATDPERG